MNLAGKIRDKQAQTGSLDKGYFCGRKVPALGNYLFFS
jgi:hypothetical protein